MMKYVLGAAVGALSMVACGEALQTAKSNAARDAGAFDMSDHDASVSVHDASVSAHDAGPVDAFVPRNDAAADDAGALASPLLQCRFDRSETACAVDLVYGWVGPGNHEDVKRIVWQVTEKPAGSQVNSFGVSAFADAWPTLTPDVPGKYRICVQPLMEVLEVVTDCCEFDAPPAFAYAFDPKNSTNSLQDLELHGGYFNFAFTTNQQVDLKTAEVDLNGAQVSGYGGGSTGVDGSLSFGGTLAHLDGDAPANLKDLVHVGDKLRLKGTVAADLHCHDVEIVQETMLIDEPEAPAKAPLVTEVVFADAASQQQLDQVPIRVRFDPSRPAGSTLAMGGWWSFNIVVNAFVHDDGIAPDDVAGDGWYSGTHLPFMMQVMREGDETVQPRRLARGSYDMLVRAVNDKDVVWGGSFRTTLVVDDDLSPDAGFVQ